MSRRPFSRLPAGTGRARQPLDRALRARLIERLRPLRHGQLDHRGRLWARDRWGARAAARESARTIRVDDPALYRALAMRRCGGGRRVLHRRTVALRRSRRPGAAPGAQPRAARWPGGRLGARRRLGCCAPGSPAAATPAAAAASNIAAHYDLGNEFFALFLSPDLMYSSALWAPGSDTLERASTRKLERICTALELRPRDRGGRDRHGLGRLRAARRRATTAAA